MHLQSADLACSWCEPDVGWVGGWVGVQEEKVLLLAGRLVKLCVLAKQLQAQRDTTHRHSHQACTTRTVDDVLAGRVPVKLHNGSGGG